MRLIWFIVIADYEDSASMKSDKGFLAIETRKWMKRPHTLSQCEKERLAA